MLSCFEKIHQGAEGSWLVGRGGQRGSLGGGVKERIHKSGESREYSSSFVCFFFFLKKKKGV